MEYTFKVTVGLASDDQTDPEELAQLIEDVLNCRKGATVNWQEAFDDMVEEYRPTYVVKEE